MRYLAALIVLLLASPLAAAAEMIWPPGSDCEYVGHVKYGRPHGQGSQRCTDGEEYVGNWMLGKFHGQGTWTFGGFKYVGWFKDGKYDGQGTFTSPDGSKHVGEWKDDEAHGQGTEYNADGSVERQGWWCNDRVSDDPCPD